MQPLRSVGRSNFDKGRHNLTTLIQKSTYINESCYLIYIYIYIFFYAAIAKCWKVQLSNGLRKINLTTLIQKRHILTRTTMLYIYIYNDTQNVLSDVRNTAYSIVIN